MPIDHSLTYKVFSLKNIPHKLRLSKLKNIVAKHISPGIARFADVGCSNGFLTDLLATKIRAEQTVGFDLSDNLMLARRNYPRYRFVYLDLNLPLTEDGDFGLVTCLETLEHVGDIEQAIFNLITLAKNGGVVIISVPIEIGFMGVIKYLAKRYVYRYELPLTCSDFVYLKALVLGKNISQFREKSDGYGSHFGFDYRTVDYVVKKDSRIRNSAIFNSFTTRFYVLDIRK